MFKVQFPVFNEYVGLGLSFARGGCDGGRDAFGFGIFFDDDSIFRELFLDKDNFFYSLDDEVSTWVVLNMDLKKKVIEQSMRGSDEDGNYFNIMFHYHSNLLTYRALLHQCQLPFCLST